MSDRRSIGLRGRPPHVLCSRPCRAVRAELEFHGIALPQHVDPFPVDRAPVEEVFLPSPALMEPNPFSARNVLVPVIDTSIDLDVLGPKALLPATGVERYRLALTQLLRIDRAPEVPEWTRSLS